LVGNARLTGNYQEAQQLGREAFEQFRQNGDKAGMAVALYELSLLAVDMGQYEEALTLARESVSITQGFNPMIRIMGLFPLGLALYALGEYGEAEEQFRQFLTAHKEFGREDWQLPLFLLGEVAFRKREYARAAQLYEDSLATAAEFGNLLLVIRNHLSLGSVNVVQGRVIEARKNLHTALQAAIKLNWRPLLLDCFVGIAELLSEEGDIGYAAMLATLIMADPASRAMTKERGERLLARLQKDLSFDGMDAIRQRSKQNEVGTVAAQLLLDLETP
jgi:tetratricopeptide (TPR) repeat protein